MTTHDGGDTPRANDPPADPPTEPPTEPPRNTPPPENAAGGASQPSGAQPDAAQPKWQIRPLRIVGLESAYDVEGRGIVLGRAPGASVELEADRFPHVSGHHARVSLDEDGTPCVEDLGSKNGTYVNGDRVERGSLVAGDVIQLGTVGPRFLVADGNALTQTLALRASDVPLPGGADEAEGANAEFGRTTIVNLKRALGISPEGVGDMVETGQCRFNALLIFVFGVIVIFGVFAFVLLRETDRDRRASQEALEKLAERLRSSQERIDAQETALIEQRRDLESRRDELRGQIDALESTLERSEQASSGELARLRENLDATQDRLTLYDPINLSRQRLEQVRRAGQAVVLIEVSWRYRDPLTDNLLREISFPDLTLDPDSEAEPYRRESTGSGFCVSPEGWIVSNAHVVIPDDIEFGGRQLKAEDVRVSVVFSGESNRVPAAIVRTAYDGEEDLALLKIAPFGGMPVLAEFSVKRPPPAVGSEVYLYGFPLGKHALQDADRVIASTFKGILSRQVEPYLQVDAAVHLGNSGGPVVDGEGRVIGVVVGVQTRPDGEPAAGIGYVIPIAQASLIWPPPSLPDEKRSNEPAG